MTDDEIERLVSELVTLAFESGERSRLAADDFAIARRCAATKATTIAAFKALRDERDVAQANEALLWERLGYAESEIERLKMEML